MKCRPQVLNDCLEIQHKNKVNLSIVHKDFPSMHTEITIEDDHYQDVKNIETSNYSNDFDPQIIEDVTNLEEYCGTWLLNPNGDICLVKDYSEDISVHNGIVYETPELTVSSSIVDDNTEEEREPSNLSWLLNFKVDSLFKGKDVIHDHSYPNSPEINVSSPKGSRRKDRLCLRQDLYDPLTISTDSKSNRRCAEEVTVTVSSSKVYTSRKPPYTYSDLIERALKEFGELTVSGIYNWISCHFPYYKAEDDRWKNSVRHNLSINPHFRKGRKSTQGAGHLWCIASSCKDTAAYSPRSHLTRSSGICDVSVEEVNAATASIEDDKENRLGMKEEYFFKECDMEMEHCGFSEQTLVQTAEEVLKGVKKQVKVQYVTPTQKKYDFLNPISMEEVVEESGLSYQLGSTVGEDGNSFLVTEINPVTLGINMAEETIIGNSGILFPDDEGNHMGI